MKLVFEEIEKQYDRKPIVVIHNKQQETDMLKLAKNNKYKIMHGINE